jgi:hypothetical protein
MPLNLYDPEAASAAREQGLAYFRVLAGGPNPHAKGSFANYCWQAGYNQDVRSIEELHRDWLKASVST